MLILLHVLIAIGSMILSGVALVWPSNARVKYSYGLVGLTLATGTYLVWHNHAHLIQSCLTGIVYLSLTTGALVFARRRVLALTVSA
jgi:hypothetical protein